MCSVSDQTLRKSVFDAQSSNMIATLDGPQTAHNGPRNSLLVSAQLLATD